MQNYRNYIDEEYINDYKEIKEYFESLAVVEKISEKSLGIFFEDNGCDHWRIIFNENDSHCDIRKDPELNYLTIDINCNIRVKEKQHLYYRKLEEIASILQSNPFRIKIDKQFRRVINYVIQKESECFEYYDAMIGVKRNYLTFDSELFIKCQIRYFGTANLDIILLIKENIFQKVHFQLLGLGSNDVVPSINKSFL